MVFNTGLLKTLINGKYFIQHIFCTLRQNFIRLYEVRSN